MTFPRYIARVPGEAFDADQIEHDGDDPFYMTDAEWDRAKAQSDATSQAIRDFNARQAAKAERGTLWL